MVHTDVKLENILVKLADNSLSSDIECKLAGFGGAEEVLPLSILQGGKF